MSFIFKRIENSSYLYAQRTQCSMTELWCHQSVRWNPLFECDNFGNLLQFEENWHPFRAFRMECECSGSFIKIPLELMMIWNHSPTQTRIKHLAIKERWCLCFNYDSLINVTFFQIKNEQLHVATWIRLIIHVRDRQIYSLLQQINDFKLQNDFRA